MKWSEWDFTLDSHTPPWGMDKRHVEMIVAVLCHLKVERAVEIGCLMGRSTTAFVEAKKRVGWLRWVGLCDKEPTEEIRKVCAHLATAGVRVERFWNYSGMIPWCAECWLIDGDHSEEGAMSDYTKATANGGRIFILHDTSHKQFAGPGKVAEAIRASGMMQTWEDNAKREGEETERGLFIAAPYLPPDLLAELEQLAKRPTS